MTESADGNSRRAPGPPLESTSKKACPAHASGSMLNPISFLDIANGRSEVWVTFEGQQYRLSSTKQGKLILTK